MDNLLPSSTKYGTTSFRLWKKAVACSVSACEKRCMRMSTSLLLVSSSCIISSEATIPFWPVIGNRYFQNIFETMCIVVLSSILWLICSNKVSTQTAVGSIRIQVCNRLTSPVCVTFLEALLVSFWMHISRILDHFKDTTIHTRCGCCARRATTKVRDILSKFTVCDEAK